MQAPRVFSRVALVVLIVTPLFVFYGLYLTTYLHRPNPRTAWVSWYGNPQHEVYVGWETREDTRGVVAYGLSPDSTTTEVAEPTAGQFHVVNLTGLAPDTKYYYRVLVEGTEFARGEFKTAPADPSTPFAFCLTSDPQQKFGPGWHSHLTRVLGGKQFAFVSVVGDFVEDGTRAEWDDFFWTASQYLDTTPIVPVRGNHDRPRDLNGDGTEVYLFREFFPQTDDAEKGTNKYDDYLQTYYSFDWGSVHFQVLHFPEVDIDDPKEPGGLNPADYNRSFTPDQLAWIRADLAEAQSMPFRVTLFHCPITSSGFYGPNYVLLDELLPVLHQYNVTVTVHGHAHHYERGVLPNPVHPGNDLTYFVVGCGGGLADVALRPVAETEVTFASPCYTQVDASATALAFTTFDLEGRVLDRCTIAAPSASAGGGG
ncbi:MAG: fibronectin type III domain-containing protein [Promethearchaeota archaeon]